jgi:hypothetical protein
MEYNKKILPTAIKMQPGTSKFFADRIEATKLYQALRRSGEGKTTGRIETKASGWRVHKVKL